MQYLNNIQKYIEKEGYKGYDPYDALKSPFFKFPFFKKNKLVRFGTQQLLKRLPVNIRPLLLVPKGYNPVTLGLCAQAYAYLCQTNTKYKELYIQKITYLINELKGLIPNGFSGACWGYDFDWEARYAKIPEYQPTVVATGIVSNALYVVYTITGIKAAAELVVGSANFVVEDLNRTYRQDSFCFSYSPFDNQQVFNASMKGVRILSQAYSITEKDEYKDLATQAVKFVVSYQKDDGSWDYSLASAGGWVDNYHTGYVLDCLDEYQKLTGDASWMLNLNKGFVFYREHFITEKGIPKFYRDRIYPVDCTAAAQTILTLVRFGDINLAEKTATWMHRNMQKKNGSFRFRKFKNYTINTSFMRWSNAWMFAALANLALQKKRNN